MSPQYRLLVLGDRHSLGELLRLRLQMIDEVTGVLWTFPQARILVGLRGQHPA